MQINFNTIKVNDKFELEGQCWVVVNKVIFADSNMSDIARANLRSNGWAGFMDIRKPRGRVLYHLPVTLEHTIDEYMISRCPFQKKR